MIPDEITTTGETLNILKRDAFAKGVQAERTRVLTILKDQDCGGECCTECSVIAWAIKEIEKTK